MTDTDQTDMLLEVELDRIRRLRDWIVADHQTHADRPEGWLAWDQHHWFLAENDDTVDFADVGKLANWLEAGRLSHCNTSCCVAGYVVYDDMARHPETVTGHTGSPESIELRAAAMLGLGDENTEWLFSAGQDRQDIVAALDLALENGGWPHDGLLRDEVHVRLDDHPDLYDKYVHR